MKKTALMILVISLLSTACQKENEVKVTYIETDAVSAYNLQYLDTDAVLMKTTISPESAQDQWKFEFMGNQGDIVYVSGNYKDINSALTIMILLDGKVYKTASNEGDTLKYLTVSGTIPYKD
jgi:hypothetical protein